MPIVGAPSTTVELILDPITEDATNVEVELTDDTNYGLIAHAYPTPPAAFQWASSVSTEGAVLSSQRHENRTITLTLEVTGLGALYDLEQKIGKLYREGGTLKRTFSDSREIVFDVLTVSNYDATFEQLHHLGGVTPVTITLECKPYGRQPEVDLGDNVETTLPVLIFTETNVPGDMPALGRLVIDNDQATTQGWGVWGIRSRYYSSAATAALFYQAESCANAGGGVATAVGAAGASGTGSNVIRHTSLLAGSVYLPLVYVGTSSTAQTHVGDFRVFARFYAPATNTGTVSVQLEWAPQVMPSGHPPTVINTPVDLADGAGVPIEGSWMLVDLGTVHLPPATVGTQGWLGLIEASSTGAGDDIDIDSVFLAPVAEGYGEVTADVATTLSIQVAHNGVRRSAAGGYWVSPTKYEGDYLLIPPSGQEARTLEVFVKLSRGRRVTGNTSVISTDGAPDDVSARLFVTPRFLVVPA